MQNTFKKLTLRSELRATAVRSDIANQLMRLAKDARSGDLELFVAAKNAVHEAIGRELNGELSWSSTNEFRAGRIRRLLSSRDREIDLNFILDIATRAYCADIPQHFDANPVSDDLDQHAPAAIENVAREDGEQKPGAINKTLKGTAMKDLIQNIISNPDAYPYVPSYARIAYPHAPVSIEADSPFSRVAASGVTVTGDNYPELAELAVAEFRKLFAEIETPGFSWDIQHYLEGNEMHVQVYLTHANGLPDGNLPDLYHPTNALWDALGMGHYGKHSACGNDTEVRMWMMNLDEQFS